MDNDLMLVVGLVIAGFSIPSIISAISDSRAPRASAITVLIAGGLILIAINGNPGGYSLSSIPDVFIRVFARYAP